VDAEISLISKPGEAVSVLDQNGRVQESSAGFWSPAFACGKATCWSQYKSWWL